jgi:hypothetical protein
MDAIFITNFSDEDSFLGNNTWKPEIFASSVYFDLEDPIENNLTKIDGLMKFVRNGRILIATDSNASSKTWHGVKTNSGGRKMEEYIASKQLHIINEESESFTFQTSRGSSNIDLTVTNHNLLAAVSEWEISPEESLSDHNYLKYKIGIAGASNYNTDNKSQGIRYIIKE